MRFFDAGALRRSVVLLTTGFSPWLIADPRYAPRSGRCLHRIVNQKSPREL